MNGWTPPIPLKTRINNLLDQIPQEHRASACVECYGTDDFDFERNLTSYVMSRKWVGLPHPAEVAYELEKAMDAEDEYPLYFNGGEVEEFRPHRPATFSEDDNIPF